MAPAIKCVQSLLASASEAYREWDSREPAEAVLPAAAQHRLHLRGVTEETGSPRVWWCLDCRTVVQRGLSIAARQREPFGFPDGGWLDDRLRDGGRVQPWGAVLSLLPPTGICLPLVSYGALRSRPSVLRSGFFCRYPASCSGARAGAGR
jgi:hypothetical protein